MKTPGEMVDERSEELTQEFLGHWRECRAKGMTDYNTVFQGWAIQKIAGLQLAVEKTARASVVFHGHDE